MAIASEPRAVCSESSTEARVHLLIAVGLLDPEAPNLAVPYLAHERVAAEDMMVVVMVEVLVVVWSMPAGRGLGCAFFVHRVSYWTAVNV